MRKLISIIVAIVALGAVALPSIASADVPRCEASVPTSTVIKTATFSTTTPSGAGGLWTTDFTVVVNPEDNTFAGTGVTSGMDYDGFKSFPEEVKGTFNSNGTVTMTVNRAFIYTSSWTLTNAPMNGTVTNATTDPAVSWTVAETVSAPVFTTTVTTTPGTESVKNHGQFVKAQGGGKTAAQACAGMPLNSTQGGGILK